MATDPMDELSNTVLGPAGRLGDVIADAPRLTHRVQALESDRRALLDAVTSAPRTGTARRRWRASCPPTASAAPTSSTRRTASISAGKPEPPRRV
ncbi:hypothetical protein ACFQY4_04915 [Catellatospora bangladeshensis]|uniref:hypothetical protein n=1 Tax=Catellatospora bangladeshensis TaxID=310355 RepID=UPI003611321C